MASLKFDEEELKKIKITIGAEDGEIEDLERSIDKPEEITLLRRPSEGKTPLFDRAQVVANLIETEISYTNSTNNNTVMNSNLVRDYQKEEEMINDHQSKLRSVSPIKIVYSSIYDRLDKEIQERKLISKDTTYGFNLPHHKINEGYLTAPGTSQNYTKNSKDKYKNPKKSSIQSRYAKRQCSRPINSNRARKQKNYNSLRKYEDSESLLDNSYTDNSFQLNFNSETNHDNNIFTNRSKKSRQFRDSKRKRSPSTSSNRIKKHKKMRNRSRKYDYESDSESSVDSSYSDNSSHSSSSSLINYRNLAKKDVKNHRFNAAMYAIRIIMEVLNYNFDEGY